MLHSRKISQLVTFWTERSFNKSVYPKLSGHNMAISEDVLMKLATMFLHMTTIPLHISESSQRVTVFCMYVLSFLLQSLPEFFLFFSLSFFFFFPFFFPVSSLLLIGESLNLHLSSGIILNNNNNRIMSMRASDWSSRAHDANLGPGLSSKVGNETK